MAEKTTKGLVPMTTRSLSLESNALYLVYLLNCALRDEVPDTPLESVNLPAVHALARRNNVEGAAWCAMEKIGCALLDSELAKTWRAEADAVLWRRVMFDVQREEVIAALGQAGIACLPLKGSVIAPLYPRPEMRWMCDNDLLYGYVEPASDSSGFRVRGGTPEERVATANEALSALVPIMESLGFIAKRESLGVGNADVFTKPPLFNFEMHRVLATPETGFSNYYENPWKHAVQDAENPFLFGFSREDTYLYHVAHAYKHASVAGFGIRFALDEKVLLNAWGTSLDWGYIDTKLAELGVVDFERELRELAETVLGPEAGPAGVGLSERQRELVVQMCTDGTFGTIQRKVELGLERESDGVAGGQIGIGAKLLYIKGRVFLSTDVFKCKYPFFRRHSRLLFLAPVWRVVSGIARNGSRVWAELHELLRAG